jgi:hypothetical protein
MKGKITIVLFSLVLVFGMLAASCDNGAYPDELDGDDSTYLAYKIDGRNLPVAVLEEIIKEENKKDGVLIDGKYYKVKEAPQRMPSAQVYGLLQEETTKWSDDHKSYTTVKAYMPAKVSTATPKGQSDYAGEELIRAKYFAGMPIVIPNPDL